MDLKIFGNSDFGKIRTFDIGGEPWFVGKDICTVFGDKNHNRSIGRVDDVDKATTPIIDNLGRQQNVTIVNESGLYSLLFAMQPQKANKDGVSDAYPIEAQQRLDKIHRFKRWVTSEVLPAIRKTGSYSVNQTDSYMISDPIKRAERWIEEEKVRQALALKVESQSKEIKIMQPKADYFDDLVDRNLLTGFRETAKELKVGERNFIKFLLDNKFVFRDGNKKLMPYANKNDGLFEVKEVKNSKSSWSGVRTMITPKGRETFRLLMKRSKT